MICAYLGFDIGGTNVKYLVCDSKLNKIQEGCFPTESKLGIDNLVNKMCLIHDKIQTENKIYIKSIGIGCTGPLDIRSGIILNPFTLPGLENNSLTTILENKLNKKVYLDNDANVAHLGEMCCRDDGCNNSIMLTFGTGVGCSVRIEKKLYRTKDLFHPEIGHMYISTPNTSKKCYCGKASCAENILSGNALNRDAKDLFNLSLEEIFENPDSIEKQKFVENIKSSLYELIVQLTIIFNPEIIIIGGGLSAFYELYVIADVQKKLNNLLPIYGKTKIESSKLKNSAGSYGAICKVLEQEN